MMRRSFGTSGCALILLGLAGLHPAALPAQGPPRPGPWRVGEEAGVLCGLQLGDSEEVARLVLGAPELVEVDPWPTLGERQASVRWPGIEAAFLDGALVRLVVSTAECGSAVGPAVGQSIGRLFSALGPVPPEIGRDGTVVYRYRVRGTGAHLLAVVRAGRIARLELRPAWS